jgi:hypothetical protein
LGNEKKNKGFNHANHPRSGSTNALPFRFAHTMQATFILIHRPRSLALRNGAACRIYRRCQASGLIGLIEFTSKRRALQAHHSSLPHSTTPPTSGHLWQAAD